MLTCIPLHRYIIAYCMAHIIESEIDEFKTEWNDHNIRANSKTALPSGRPNDLYDMTQTYGKHIERSFASLTSLIIGVEDHLQPVNASIWTHAMNKESIPTPRFYTHLFEFRADRLLARRFKIKRCDINAENCETIYKFFIQNM